MLYVSTLTICLRLVYFVSAAGCHCVDLKENAKPYARHTPMERRDERKSC